MFLKVCWMGIMRSIAASGNREAFIPTGHLRKQNNAIMQVQNCPVIKVYSKNVKHLLTAESCWT